ncbi:Glycosyltransferase, catalytic subunit of cellulose synthase and poly-beta-1,6-N-acetylglucosamine synthase [bacterium A37T11]|nr:Glycosyltransferase, catalytic subunit of cellulose synthase and poly-beta-1,6-N-acetylglucosamine synthase [bacterium A37T11]
MIWLFWICIGIVFYTFVGYGILLFVLVLIKRLVHKSSLVINMDRYLPFVSIIVAAYNEEDVIAAKIDNCLNLIYPSEKLQIIIVSDGSTDRTAEIVKRYPNVLGLHQADRFGKMAAIKRAMPLLTGEITVFTDANTFLNREAIEALVRHYENSKVGAVAGEKKVYMEEIADASSAGEGLYWKYESALKKWDYELYSNVGAAGELFSIRTSLYEPVEDDTIIDDHMIAMRIAEKGFLIAYEPGAYAMETASANIKEELKRKIRIAAGGMQSIIRLKKAINPFYNPLLTFQYVSHRVLRWTIAPFLLILVFVLNGIIILQNGQIFYLLLFVIQLIFYGLALAGYYLESRQIRLKSFFVPYYFCIMNYAVIAGINRYFQKAQGAAWEKSKRK